MPRKGPDTQVMSGAKGAIVVNDNTEKVFDCDMIVILEDNTQIDRIEVDGDTATDVKATYITTDATPLVKGAILTPLGAHKYFSAITLNTTNTGSVNLVAQVEA